MFSDEVIGKLEENYNQMLPAKADPAITSEAHSVFGAVRRVKWTLSFNWDRTITQHLGRGDFQPYRQQLRHHERRLELDHSGEWVGPVRLQRLAGQCRDRRADGIRTQRRRRSARACPRSSINNVTVNDGTAGNTAVFTVTPLAGIVHGGDGRLRHRQRLGARRHRLHRRFGHA